MLVLIKWTLSDYQNRYRVTELHRTHRKPFLTSGIQDAEEKGTTQVSEIHQRWWWGVLEVLDTPACIV